MGREKGDQEIDEGGAISGREGRGSRLVEGAAPLGFGRAFCHFGVRGSGLGE